MYYKPTDAERVELLLAKIRGKKAAISYPTVVYTKQEIDRAKKVLDRLLATSAKETRETSYISYKRQRIDEPR